MTTDDLTKHFNNCTKCFADDSFAICAVGKAIAEELKKSGQLKPKNSLLQATASDWTSLELKIIAQHTEKCTACNGSGRYDNTGSPPCGACNGSGRQVKGE